ncbi:MAG: hypothetical protein QY326_00070 [Bdellovibrionota bacterium]|nr:MAG: hypothetical protein QY326_00070 [Bdellovibrionota bacterium]
MKQKLSLLILLTSAIVFGFAGCGSSGGDDSDDGAAGGNEQLPESNPIAQRSETFGVDGNLWKPAGDDHGAGAGNLVVLLSSRYTKRFDTCELQRTNGQIAQLTCIDNVPWTHTPYSCFANGDRQHWRADFKCSEAAEVKVTCRDANQEVTFTVDASQRGSVCNRFG